MSTSSVLGNREGLILRDALFARLSGARRITVVSAPAGSGKTCLLRSWIGEAGLSADAAWVPVGPEEHDPQRFWIAVLDALRETAAGASAVRALTPAPILDGGAIVEHLLEDVGAIEEPLWLVLDDLHELRSPQARRQLALLLMRAPAQLRFVLSTRSEIRLGLHRLRLDGEVTELRAADLRFSLEEARALFRAAGVCLPEPALARLYERTEGWCAGLRLAALSLTGHPDPERFAAEFGGSERTVAEYLLAEVLERQSEDVRQLLLRTSILDRVNGPLADLLTGGQGGEHALQELERAGAFVVSLDAQRSWFRYHALFADLLRLELRRTAPGRLAPLHEAAAAWLAGHGFPVEAVRHAQAAEEWRLAAEVLCDNCLTLRTGGQWATAQALLAGFPADVVAADPELPVFVAIDELLRGSLLQAEHQLALAAGRAASLPAERRVRLQARIAVTRLWVGLRRCDPPAVVAEAARLLGTGTAGEAVPGLDDDLRAMALSCHGIGDLWRGRHADAEPYLAQARALARRTGQRYVEVSSLAYSAMPLMYRSFALARRTSLRAIEEARQHGWDDAPIAGIASTVLAAILVWQAHLDEAQHWLDRAQRTLTAESVPAAGLWLRLARGQLELARGRDQEALTALASAVRLDELLVARHPMAGQAHGLMVQAMVRLGDRGGAELALAALGEATRGSAELRKATAALRLAEDDPEGAAEAVAPVVDGSVPVVHPAWLVEAHLLDALAREALGDAGAAGRALERALDLAEPDGALWPFLLHPAPGLLARHPRLRTTHAALVGELRGLLAGRRRTAPPGEPAPLLEPLSESETRVLRYLPTNLSAPEIAGELFVAASTVKTHIKHIYGKLGVHSRAEAVERARAAGLLAPTRG